MTKFQVWKEGYAITGNDAPATYCGECEAETFDDACRAWAMEKPDRLADFRPRGGRPAHWGCRFFDNEADARKSFG